MYKYREIICPWCSHRFMWKEDCDEGLIIRINKETGEDVTEAKCPKCSESMAVLNESLTGIFLDDKRLEIKGFQICN